MTTILDKSVCSISQNIEEEFNQLQNNSDQLRQQINDLKIDSTKHLFIKQIDQWEHDSINKIQQQAKQCRIQWMNYLNRFLLKIEKKLNHLDEQIKENQFNQIHLKQRLESLNKQLNQPTNVSIYQQTRPFIEKLSLLLPSDMRWKQFATTIAGGNGQGNRLDQLNYPQGISIDNLNEMIYIADRGNHRIIEIRMNTNHSRIVAGGNGQGNRLDQLDEPTDVIIDRQNNDLIIADYGNRRVVRCSRHSNSPVQFIINDIDCSGLAMHEDGSLYVSDYKNNEVKRWKRGEMRGTVVAGGNGQGNQLNQLNCPLFLFIDDDHTVYITDWGNHRVMKWIKDTKEGVVVAGGNGQGNQLTQLSRPQGIMVDESGQIYVADCDNHRVMRWCERERKGIIVVGGNGQGREKNQLNCPVGLSLDGEGNLYVADCGYHQIDKFERDLD